MLPPGGHFGCQFQAFANISNFLRKIAMLKSCQYSGGTLVVLWWYSGKQRTHNLRKKVSDPTKWHLEEQNRHDNG